MKERERGISRIYVDTIFHTFYVKIWTEAKKLKTEFLFGSFAFNIFALCWRAINSNFPCNWLWRKKTSWASTWIHDYGAASAPYVTTRFIQKQYKLAIRSKVFICPSTQNTDLKVKHMNAWNFQYSKLVACQALPKCYDFFLCLTKLTANIFDFEWKMTLYLSLFTKYIERICDGIVITFYLQIIFDLCIYSWSCFIFSKWKKLLCS